jgi:hypothetical protein
MAVMVPIDPASQELEEYFRGEGGGKKKSNVGFTGIGLQLLQIALNIKKGSSLRSLRITSPNPALTYEVLELGLTCALGRY